MWRYYAFRFAGATIGRMPVWAGHLIARIVADLVYLLLPGTRAPVEDNMRHVLGPAVDDKTLERNVRGVLRNSAKNYYDLIRIPHLKLDEINRKIIVNGYENLAEALSRGKGVILITAHIGSFDMALQILAARSIKTLVLVELLDPPALYRHVTSLRERNGIECLPIQAEILMKVIRFLKRGEVVLIACDRDVNGDGQESIFFGAQTTLPKGAVRIALRTGAAIVPAFNLRRDDGCYDVYFEPALELGIGGSEDIADNFEKVIQVMEKYISKCPDQWVVLNSVWNDKNNEVTTWQKVDKGTSEKEVTTVV